MNKKCLGVTIAFLLAGCGGGGSDSGSSVSQPTTPTPTPPTSETPTPAPTPVNQYVATPPSGITNTLAAGGCGEQAVSTNSAFTNISNAAGLCYPVQISAQDSIPARVGGGAAVNDIDDDGDLDVYITHGRNEPGRLFMLDEDFRFINSTEQSGIRTLATDHGGAFVDVDDDGDQDLLSFQESEPFIQFFANQGEGRFVDISHLVDITMTKEAYSIAGGDIDLDGDLDLFFSHWHPEQDQDAWEFLWRRDAPGQYEDVSDILDLEPFNNPNSGPMEEEYSFTPSFVRITEDEFPDLLVASDFSTSQYMVNNVGASFVDVTIGAVINDRAGMGSTVGDYDNDGDLDWFVSAIGDPREEVLRIGLFDGNRLYHNDGDGNFLNFTDFAGVRQGYWAWGTCFADVNNDGYEDIFLVNGYEGWNEEQAQAGNFSQFLTTPALLYINQQDGTFEEQALALGVDHTAMGRGLVCYDYDRDGDVDLLVMNSGESPTLFRNDRAAEGTHFVNIRLEGVRENPQVVGARIHLSSGGITQMRELQLGGLYVSQNPIEAHFGLAGNTQIDNVRIEWPGTEYEDTVLQDVPVDHFIVVQHPELLDD